MGTVTITIDGREVIAEKNRMLLWVALESGIYIPHLCSLEEKPKAFGGCRLCYVEIEGRKQPVTSCSEPVKDSMVVRTNTPATRRLAERSFELTLSAHPLPCKGCHAHGSCTLQEIAKNMRFKLKHPKLETIETGYPVDDSHASIIFDPNYCVLCGLCVYMCNDVEKAHAIDFEFRGMDMRVGTTRNIPLADSSCTSCMKCTEVCPVGAFRKKPSTVGLRPSAAERRIEKQR